MRDVEDAAREADIKAREEMGQREREAARDKQALETAIGKLNEEIQLRMEAARMEAEVKAQRARAERAEQDVGRHPSSLGPGRSR